MLGYSRVSVDTDGSIGEQRERQYLVGSEGILSGRNEGTGPFYGDAMGEYRGLRRSNITKVPTITI